jgi:hypothetical protein
VLRRLSRGDCAGECASTEQVQRCIGACAEVQERCKWNWNSWRSVMMATMYLCWVLILAPLLPTFHHFTPSMSLMDNDGGGEVEDGG